MPPHLLPHEFGQPQVVGVDLLVRPWHKPHDFGEDEEQLQEEETVKWVEGT